MTTLAPNPLNPSLFEIPDPPEEFGQDGGKFYRYYDKFAEEIDEDMVKGLKEQLDGLLIFAGLFAGVNTAFLALTLPSLSANPADDTNALLSQNNAILMQLAMGRNDSLPTQSSLPSASFFPAHDVVAVNVLFSLSLAFALVSSFLAVLGRQWLVYYRKRSGGGPDRQRWEQLKRFLGAERWRLELILDDILPALLQIGLIIFCVSLVIYLGSLNRTVFKIARIPLYLGLAFFVGSAICMIWDRFCPFHSSLSHLLSSFVSAVRHFVTGARLIWEGTRDFWIMHRGLDHYPRNSFEAAHERHRERLSRLMEVVLSSKPQDWIPILPQFRPEEPIESLQVTALRRLICTSEDPITLLWTAAHIPTITNHTELMKLWTDDLFRERLIELYRGSTDMTLKSLGRSRVDIAAAVRQLYASATMHFILYLNIPFDNFEILFRCLRETEGFKSSSIWIPTEISRDWSPFQVKVALSLCIISIRGSRPSYGDIHSLCNYLNVCSDTLLDPDWRLFSLICWIVANLPRIKDLDRRRFDSFRKLMRGDTAAAVRAIDRTIKVMSTRNRIWSLDCHRVMANILMGLIRAISDETPHLPFSLDQIVRVLQSVETALRETTLSMDVRSLMGALRNAVVDRILKTSFITLHSGDKRAELHEEVFDALIALFRSLTYQKMGRFTYDDDRKTSQTFEPLVQEIFSTVLYQWEQVAYPSREAYPDNLRQRLDAVSRSWRKFLIRVEDLRRMQQKQNDIRRLRDPEERWCHWQEELWYSRTYRMAQGSTESSSVYDSDSDSGGFRPPITWQLLSVAPELLHSVLCI